MGQTRRTLRFGPRFHILTREAVACAGPGIVRRPGLRLSRWQVGGPAVSAP